MPNTLHAALLSAQNAGFTSATLPDDETFTIQDAIEFMAVPGQVAYQGVPAHDPEGPYTLTDTAILNAAGETALRIGRN